MKSYQSLHGYTPGQPKTKDGAITGQFEHSVLGGQITKAGISFSLSALPAAPV